MFSKFVIKIKHTICKADTEHVFKNLTHSFTTQFIHYSGNAQVLRNIVILLLLQETGILVATVTISLGVRPPLDRPHEDFMALIPALQNYLCLFPPYHSQRCCCNSLVFNPTPAVNVLHVISILCKTHQQDCLPNFTCTIFPLLNY